MASFHWTFLYLCNFQSLKDPSAVCIGPPFSQPFIVSPFHCCIFVLFFSDLHFRYFCNFVFSFFQSLKDPSAVSIGPPVSQLCMSPPFWFCIFVVSDFWFFYFFCNFVFSIFEGSKCSLHWASVGFTAAPLFPGNFKLCRKNVLDNIKDIKSWTYLGAKIPSENHLPYWIFWRMGGKQLKLKAVGPWNYPF